MEFDEKNSNLQKFDNKIFWHDINCQSLSESNGCPLNEYNRQITKIYTIRILKYTEINNKFFVSFSLRVFYFLQKILKSNTINYCKRKCVLYLNKTLYWTIDILLALSGKRLELCGLVIAAESFYNESSGNT